MRTGTAVASETQNAPSLQPGDVILGRYELVHVAGRGGAGTVWKAEDRDLGRPVAVKCLPREGEDRALQEARAAARLSHPAIVSTYGLGSADGCAWLVTEFVAGATLRQTIVEDTHDDDELLQIGVALCAALRHAHGRGIVHRDVTPRNVLVPAGAFVGTDRNRPCHPGITPAKLADFGIARPTGKPVESANGRIVGTLSYMAPERLHGAVGDEAGDLWALAVVLHEAFVGEHPAGKPDRAGALVRTHTELPSLAPRRPDLPAVVTDAIDRAAAAESADRGTVADLERALRDGLTERGVAVAPILRDGSRRAAPDPIDVGAASTWSRRRSPIRRPALLPLAPIAAGLGAAAGAWAAVGLLLAAVAIVLVGLGAPPRADDGRPRIAAGLVLLAVVGGLAGLLAALATAVLGLPSGGPAAPVIACLGTVALGGWVGRRRLPRSMR